MYLVAPWRERGKSKHKAILILGFYRNQLLHLFTLEGMISCSLWNSNVEKKGMTKEALIKEAFFLHNVLKSEFVNKPNLIQEKDIERILLSMIDRGLLRMTDVNNQEIVSVSERSSGVISFYCHLYWPFVESYWVLAISLFSLQPDHMVRRNILLQRASWIAEKMHEEGRLSFYESCNMEVLMNALLLFQEWNIVVIKKQDSTPEKKRKLFKKKSEPENPFVLLTNPYREESPLQELVEHINHFKKIPPSQTREFRTKMMTDFPVLAKL